MDNTLVLFTDGFPVNGVTENAFILPEIQYLQRDFSRIIYVPNDTCGLKESSIELRKNDIIELTYNSMSPLKSKFRFLQFGIVVRRFLISPGIILNPKKFIASIKDEIVVRHFSAWFKRFQKKYSLDDSSTLYYSFWFSAPALGLGNIATKQRNIVALCRCHHYDLYFPEITSSRIRAVNGLVALFPCSRDGEKYLKECYPMHYKKIITQYLGIDDREWYFVPHFPKYDKNIYFLSCHNLIPRKRALLCAECLEHLAKDNPEWNFHWYLIGDGVERVKIEEWRKLIPCNLDVSLLGQMTNKQVHNFYQNNRVDFHILLSESEGLPVALQEAMFYGVPVIACDANGTRECVNNDVGELLPLDISPTEFSKRITSLLDNYKERKRMCDNARLVCEDMFFASKNRNLFCQLLLRNLNTCSDCTLM